MTVIKAGRIRAELAVAAAGSFLLLTIAGGSPAIAADTSPAPNSASHRDRDRDDNLANVDPASRALLIKMWRAEHTLPLSGEQTTIIYRATDPEIRSTQTVKRDGKEDYRIEFHSPDRIAGEILVKHGNMAWHYIPSRKVVRVGPPHIPHWLPQLHPAMHALHTGNAQASILGDETVAGRATKVLQIAGTGTSPAGTVKLWIDVDTGAQLKIEVYDTASKLLSTSYFTQISYNPDFPDGTFDAPVVPPGTKTEADTPPSSLNHVPSDAEAGFHVLKPGYVPTGYKFQSASVFQFAGRKAVAVRYGNGLTMLSVFESMSEANHPVPDFVRQPRPGVVFLNQNGMDLLAMGSVANDDMLNVLKSMR